MPTVREIQEAVSRLYDAGVMDSDAVLQKLYEEFGGDIPVQDLEKAFAGLADELAIRAYEEKEQAQIAKRYLALIKRAQQESGQTGMTAGDAAKFLADRGDEEGKALLKMLKSPQATAFEAEMKAAIEWHPHWHGDERGFRFDGDGEVDTPEKLLTAYRKHKQQ